MSFWRKLVLASHCVAKFRKDENGYGRTTMERIGKVMFRQWTVKVD